MADKKISQLTSATLPLVGTEVLPMVQGGATVKALQADLFQWPTGRVTYVPIGGNIQAAVTAATAGDTLILGAGSYPITATITVDKAILIKGQGLSATKVTTATADIAAFTLTASSARITDLYIGHSGTGTTYGIYAGDGLTALQVRNVTVVTSGAGVKYCVYSKSSITVSDTECYPTSSDSNSNGVYITNNSGATVNIAANIQNVRVIATGAATNNRGVVFFNNNTVKLIVGNVFNCSLTALASSGTTDNGLLVSSATSNSITANIYDTILNGADADVGHVGANTLTLFNCTLVNGTTTGTIAYGGTQVGSKGKLSSTLTMGDNVVQGTAAKGFNFTANTPAAGMTSQLLNWYEEGTWTPVIAFGGASVGITYTTQEGTYTRLGNRVLFQGRIVLSSLGSSTGTVTITGLPFTVSGYGSFSVQPNRIGATVATVLGSFSNGATSLGLSQIVAGTNTVLNDTNLTATSIFNFSGQYLV